MSQPRRVLIVTDGLANGGAERQLTLLASNLPPGWECRVWSLEDGPFASEISKRGVRVDICARRWRWDVSPAGNLWRLVRQWQPDLIHSWGYMGTLAAIPICRMLHIPLVDGTIRQANIPARRGKIWQWTLTWGDRVIANSRAGLQVFGISADRGRVVYNGFDPERLAGCPNPAPASASAFRVIMVARMRPAKDYPAFIRAASLLQYKTKESWHFGAIGNGPQRTEIMELALRAGVSMDFPDLGIDVLPYVRHANAGVLMTARGVEEGLSNALMEYMACGLPVVCSQSGGNRELVLDGETGFIIAPGDADALAEKLIWLRQHPQEAQVMRELGRRRILNEFSVETMVSKTIEVYQEIAPVRTH